MLNFRKLRQDFPSGVLKEGKHLFEQKCIVSAKVVQLDVETIRLDCRVKGSFENLYESEIEIDRIESMAIDSNCDCTYNYDCQHIAALLFYLEEKINEMVVNYSQEADLENCQRIDEDAKDELMHTIEEARAKEDSRKGDQYQKEILNEYKQSAWQLSTAPFFVEPETMEPQKAQLAVILSPEKSAGRIEFHFALRLTNRSKPLVIPNIKELAEAVRYREPIVISSKRYYISDHSFSKQEAEIFHMLVDHACFTSETEDRVARYAYIKADRFGMVLARGFAFAMQTRARVGHPDEEMIALAPFCMGNIEEPLYCSTQFAQIQFTLEYLKEPAPTLFLKPAIDLGGKVVDLEKLELFLASKPGLLHDNVYYSFHSKICRNHLQSLEQVSNMAICEPLFGTFIENSLPALKRYASVTNSHLIKQFTTLPYAEPIRGSCQINYLDGELEAHLFFIYDEMVIPAALSELKHEDLVRFTAQEGILARNLVEERKLIDDCFEGFIFDEAQGLFRLKSEKKIVEFMTEGIPKFQDRISFECPENLAEQFIYDDSAFSLEFKESNQVDSYEISLKVDGCLKGIALEALWDCIASNKRFLEIKKSLQAHKTFPRILVLDLVKLKPIVQFFDEIGLEVLENKKYKRPLWSLVSVDPKRYENLPIRFSMSKKLKEIRKQILGEKKVEVSEIPSEIKADLRSYQKEGVAWLDSLRQMHLRGILADDMGLGKTLQAICAISQSVQEKPGYQSLIICPTSLVYNWQEEFHKFNPKLRIGVVDNAPQKRRAILSAHKEYDVLITSYNLLQKDVEVYESIEFNYAILDEAQHIKNRTTRNAKSVKKLRAHHRLILTGTPIENSLDELWSLFDFLMPNFLSSYDRFIEKYIRSVGPKNEGGFDVVSLRRKVAPFILRRMKEDVLSDLPPVSEIVYHCTLSDYQTELYRSYAESARAELSKLVKEEGFDKIQIHVLATLTRLKQICCHPAIFAKENPEVGDSAKYDMLVELLCNLVENKHKTVIFSQYTKMLSIMREDLTRKAIPFAYLDGSSKNRLEIVKKFNEDPNILVFLVSLKAGGAGLNLTGADTVIHYDMWWNPAVENQATDRVHRIGQKKSVSSYKLITLNTIEEKILNLQNRKKGLVKKVINSDDEAISKLTWEEVLELLQT